MLPVLPDEHGFKKCSKCQEHKPLEGYYSCPTMKSGYRSSCIECSKESSKRFKKSPEQIKAGHLKHDYGLTVEEYAKMYKEQDGLCAICGKPETVRNHSHVISALAVDHNHETGRVRGLLCSNCNKGIGNLKEDETILLNAIEYLKKYSGLV